MFCARVGISRLQHKTRFSPLSHLKQHDTTPGDLATLLVQVIDSASTHVDAPAQLSVTQPDGVARTIALDHAGTGIYRGSLTVPISGTYIASVSVQQSGFRSEGDSAVFVVGEPSRLMPSFGGRPTLNASTPVTVTLRNERGMPVPGASVIISGTHEYYSKTSDAFGQVAVSLRPATVDPYLGHVNRKRLRSDSPALARCGWLPTQNRRCSCSTYLALPITPPCQPEVRQSRALGNRQWGGNSG